MLAVLAIPVPFCASNRLVIESYTWHYYYKRSIKETTSGNLSWPEHICVSALLLSS